MALPLPPSIDALRQLSLTRSPDPLPDGAPTPTRPWFAAPGQWELGLLHRLVREGFAAAVDVEFASNFGAVAPTVDFRLTLSAEAALTIRATGAVTLASAGASESDDGLTRLSGASAYVVTVATGDPAPLRGPSRPFRSGDDVSSLVNRSGAAGFTVVDGPAPTVEVRTGDGVWVAAAVGGGTDEVAPDALRNPVHELELHKDGDLFVLPAEVLGRVVIECPGRPTIFAGESELEARTARHTEQHHDLRPRGDGRWESVHELALRYLAVEADGVARVTVEAPAYPIRRRGAFACSDETLTDIWAASAHTLRQCTHGLLLDGIKRDRVPWMGDLAVSVPAAAYAFPDRALAERGFIALGQPVSGYVNGIVDYSLWWLICLADYARYFDGADFLAAVADDVDAALATLAGEAGDDGVLRPRPGVDAYPKAVFVDWGFDVEPGRDPVALQALWFWALRSGRELLERVGHDGAVRWGQAADRLRATLHARAWDSSAGGWREYLDGDVAASPYPGIFALLAGLTPEGAVAEQAARQLAAPETRTPFVTTFAVRALAEAGRPDAAVEQVRRRWGEMLALGATTFWEEFPEDGASPYEMYGRPFGKSLCHAWAAGPAQLLPEIVCGLRPLSDGWATFAVDPQLGDLAWAGAIVAVPGGEITVLATQAEVSVTVPAGHALVHGGELLQGPAELRFATAP